MASRRAADALIASGSVRVNGKSPPASGMLIDPELDRVTVDGRAVKPPTTHRYLMLNKPLGAITTARDEAARTTVLDVVGPEGAGGRRLFPVGRLDADSTGLLLLTDDGELAYRLTHPRYKVPKEYEVVTAGVPSSGDIKALRAGVKLDDGMTAPADVEMIRATRGERDSGRAELRVVIREGRQRQVRRMLEAVGHKSLSLRRTAFGPLRLGRLKTGGFRVLSSGEVAALRHATGLALPRSRGSTAEGGDGAT
ncbi:MAG TPA: pseudouridine synthase [Candidatus Limnocylindrales bacterium]|nr:pseudouridine synthase [Candidatus Limnocylindrales bacterium]